MEWIFGGVIGFFLGHAFAEWGERQPWARERQIDDLVSRVADSMEREEARRARLRSARRDN